MEHFRFLTTAVRDHNVGALCPTSGVGVRNICRPVIAFNRPVVVVEYGPGTGAFTRYLLKRLCPGSMLLAIELNRLFARRLRRYGRVRKAKDPRLIVANSDARNVGRILRRLGHEHADFIVSGIPFSFLDDKSKAEIIERSRAALAPDGRLVIYQYSFKIEKHLRDHFDVSATRRCFVNFPPLCVIEAKPRAVELAAAGEKFGGKPLEPALCVNASQG